MKPILLLCTFALGICAILTQLVLLREFLNLFSGNELVVGLVVGNWLLLSGTGSLLSRGIKDHAVLNRCIPLAFGVLSLISFAQLAAARLLGTTAVHGQALGAWEAFVISAIVMAPFCTVSGALLCWLSGIPAGSSSTSRIGNVYTADSLGTALGGALFSFVLLDSLDPFAVSVLTAVLCSAAAFAAHYVLCRESVLVKSCLAAAFLLLGLIIPYQADFEQQTTSWLYPGRTIRHIYNSPYGRIIAAEQAGQYAVYQNGVPLGASDDALWAEEIAHYALSQRARYKRILVLSGGIAGALTEAAKHQIEEIHYIELDPVLLKLTTAQTSTPSNRRIVYHADDARRFLRRTDIKFDAVIAAVPDPSSAALNRYYTVEFFDLVRRALTPAGVFSLSLAGSENYTSAELRALGASVWHSLHRIFPHSIVVPGAHNWFISSGAPLDYSIADRLKRQGIAAQYANDSYLHAKLSDERIRRAVQTLETKSPLNYDLAPYSYFAYLRHWVKEMDSSLLGPGLLVLAVFTIAAILVFGTSRPSLSAAVATSGFAGIGMSLILILCFQLIYGSLYSELSTIITAFMAGCGAGGFLGSFSSTKPRLCIIGSDIALALCCLAVGSLLCSSSSPAVDVGSYLPKYGFSAANFLLGIVLGAQFAAVSRVYGDAASRLQDASSHLFTLDFLASYIGAVVLGAFFIPLFGVGETCLGLALLKAASAAYLLLNSQLEESTAAADTRVGSSTAAAVVLLSMFAAAGLAVAYEPTSAVLYSVSFRPEYHWLFIAILAWGLTRAIRSTFEPREASHSSDKIGLRLASWDAAVRSATGFSSFRLSSYAIFAFTAFTPLFRCYFSIPYIFCHVCPRKCIFGYMRPYVIPGALIMNLENRHWCHNSCPIGTLHDCQSRIAPRSSVVPAAGIWIASAVIAFTAAAYFIVKSDLEVDGIPNEGWYLQFFNNSFAPHGIVILAVVVIFLLGFRYRRPFCSVLCPLGNTSELIVRAERLVGRSGSNAESQPASEHTAGTQESRTDG